MLTQDKRLLSLKTPAGDDVLLLRRVSGTEEMSRQFEFDLEMVAENDKAAKVKADDLIGKKVTFSIALEDDYESAERRYFTGIVSRFHCGGRGKRLTTFRGTVVSWTWLMSLKKDCRIFQEMTIPDVITKILDELKGDFPDLVSYTNKLTKSYSVVDYLIQFGESTLDFVARLMQEEGIFFYFEHGEDGHELILCDKEGDYPGLGSKRFDDEVGYGEREGVIGSWQRHKGMRPGKMTLRDYNFQMPSKSLEVSEVTKFEAGGNSKLEVYEYPGGYAQRFNKPDDRMGDVESEGTAMVKSRMEALEATHDRADGSSNCRDFTSGHQMEMEGFQVEGDNRAYVLTSVSHHATQSPEYETGEGISEPYQNQFQCQPDDVVVRPEQEIMPPRATGVQRAVVVGPSGEEIYTDKYGRIKVQFQWDREGENDENSSCYVRVCQPWAGRQWGAFFWPRIGDEVLIDFIDGDFSQPVVVGSLYNKENMPPYTMPDNQTRSGIKTRSSREGTAENFNELRFEDEKDEEEIYFHAEKDFNRVVENNDTLKVGFDKKDKGNQEIEIFNNQDVKIGTSEADDGSQNLEIFNNQDIKIGTPQASGSSQTVEIYKDRKVTLVTGNDKLEVKQGNVDTKVALGSSGTEAMQKIELKVGSSSITIDQMGIKLKGMMIKIEGTTMVDVKGMMTTVKGDAMLKAQGGLVMIN